MEPQDVTIRLSINTPSLPSRIKITHHDDQFRLRLSSTRSEPIQLVTYFRTRKNETDGLFGYRTSGKTKVEYHVLAAAGASHYIVLLTFIPFYQPHGPVRRVVDDQGVAKLWCGNRELKIFLWCGQYGETGPLPYRLVEFPEPAPNLPPTAPPRPGGSGGGRPGVVEADEGGVPRRGNGGPAAPLPPEHYDHRVVNNLVDVMARRNAALADENHELLYQLQACLIGPGLGVPVYPHYRPMPW